MKDNNNFNSNTVTSQIEGVSNGVPYSFLSPFPHCHLKFLHQGKPWGDVSPAEPPFTCEATRMTFNEWVGVAYDHLSDLYDCADISISPKRLRKLGIGRATKEWYRYGYAGGFPPDFLIQEWQEKQITVINDEIVELPSMLPFDNDFSACELWGGNKPPVTNRGANRGAYLTEHNNVAKDKELLTELDNVAKNKETLTEADNVTKDEATMAFSIDWLSWTLNHTDQMPDLTPLRDFLIEQVGAASEIQTGRFNIQYTNMQTFGDTLHVYWADKPEATTGRYNVHIQANGGALGVLAANGWATPDQVFSFTMKTFAVTGAVSWWPSRIDWAIDDFTGGMTADKVRQAIDERSIETKFRQNSINGKGGWRYIVNLNGNDEIGHGLTCYFGRGPKMIRFYNKAVEQGVNRVWHRAEMQLKDDYARDMVTALVGQDHDTIFRTVRAYFRSSLDFKIANPEDTNKGRWATAQWWTDFCGSETYKLVRPTFKPRLEQTMDWLSRVSASFAIVAQLGYQMSDQPTHELKTLAGENFFLNFLEMGKDIVARSDGRQRKMKAMIENFLLKRQLRVDKPEKVLELKNGRSLPLSGLYQQDGDDFNDLVLQAQRLGGVKRISKYEELEKMNSEGLFDFVF